MSEAASTFPRLNEPATDFKAKTTHGDRALADYKGKWLILFSHPTDFTPVCTTEFIGFAKAADTFKSMNCELLGRSACRSTACSRTWPGRATSRRSSGSRSRSRSLKTSRWKWRTPAAWLDTRLRRDRAASQDRRRRRQARWRGLQDHRLVLLDQVAISVEADGTRNPHLPDDSCCAVAPCSPKLC